MSYQHHFQAIARSVITLVVAAVALLALSRGMMLSLIADHSQLSTFSSDIGRAFFIGGRFDLKIAAIGFAPMLLLGLLFAATQRSFHWWSKLFPAYSALIFFLLAAFSIGNYYYYLTYGHYFDVFVFGLFDDDTEAVLIDAWLNYPILRSFFVSLFISILAYVGSKRLTAKLSNKIRTPIRVWLFAVGVVAFIAVYVVAARGSVGSLPLKRYHANVSQYKPLNLVTPNAFMALDWAKSDYKKQTNFKAVEPELVTEQMLKVLGQPTPEYQTPSNDYLAQNKPHVVMTLMEGLGQNVLIEDDFPSNDLLGALRPHFEQDFLFKRFLAGTSATIDSIVMMLFHSDIPTISHSSVQKTALPSSAVLPYKRAGYDVYFLYGGNSMWRNLANYLPYQGFDRVLDENDIKAEFPQAAKSATTWGVADEYTFRFAQKLLERAEKPTFIYIMTTTNHTPYEVPKGYQAKPVKVSDRLNQVMKNGEESASDMLTVIQYANDHLGQFISNVKSSNLGEKTVIAASGDHRMRSIATDREGEVGLVHMVPFYLYVPNIILEHTEHSYEKSRIGSHRDVMPTLYHFSLSNSDYISLGGENLLSPQGVMNYGYNSSATITAEGASYYGQTESLYPWLDDSLFTEVEAVANEEPEWASEYKKLQNYYLRSQVVK